jgi:dipeptide/tripeptide permease
LILIALTANPGLLGETFNTTALTVGLLVLYPLGAGGIKSIVNVFGAKQYHPLLQSAQVEVYYVRFYAAINVGALIGGLVIPSLCSTVDPFIAYLVPVCALSFGLLVFMAFTKRYVRSPASGKAMTNTVKVIGAATTKCSLNKVKESRGGKYDDNLVDGVRQLGSVLAVSALVIPFNVVYSQMGTTYNTQGMAMQPIGFIDASYMQNADAISVLLFGFFVSTFFYPALAKRDMRIPTVYKFALGSVFGLLSCMCAIIVDNQITSQYQASKTQVNILWQIPQFVLIGAGEIFAVSAAYEAAFNIAPKEQKAFASAINLFCIGGIPNFISSALYNACADWFQTSTGNTKINQTSDYVDTQINKFFWLLFGISAFGVVLNCLPPLMRWVARVEDHARFLADVSAHESGADSDAEMGSRASVKRVAAV